MVRCWNNYAQSQKKGKEWLRSKSKEGKGITTLKVKRRERNNYAQSQKKGKE
jgi:hypothetical protein